MRLDDARRAVAAVHEPAAAAAARSSMPSSPTAGFGRGWTPRRPPGRRPSSSLIHPGRGRRGPRRPDRAAGYDGHHSGEVSLPGRQGRAGRRRRRGDRAARGGGGDRPRRGRCRRPRRRPARRGVHPGERLPDHADRRRRGAPPDARRRTPARSPGILTPPSPRSCPMRRSSRRADDPRLADPLRRLPDRRAHVWGATGRILGQLGAVLGEVSGRLSPPTPR